MENRKFIKTVSIVVVNDDGKILALRRSEEKQWYPKKWDIISGKINTSESPDECFAREIFEEIGISVFKEIEKQPPYFYEENESRWLVHPYRCKICSDKIRLNEEHSEYNWMTLSEILNTDHAASLRTDLSVFYKI